MIWVTKTISTEIDKLKRLIQKVVRLGKDDIQTAPVAAPYGIDSNAVKDMVAIYAESSVKGENVIIGYLNTNCKAEVGGMRIFSTDATGSETFYVYLRSTNNLELGGNSRHLARFEELQTAFNELNNKFNALVTAYNGHTHPYINVLAPATTSPTATVGQPSVANIAPAKIDNIKVA